MTALNLRNSKVGGLSSIIGSQIINGGKEMYYDKMLFR